MNAKTIPDESVPTICEAVVALTRLSHIEELQPWLYERYTEILNLVIGFRAAIASENARLSFLLSITVLPVSQVAETLEVELLIASGESFEITLDWLEHEMLSLMRYALPVINDPELPFYLEESRDVFRRIFPTL
jgi:hypothetical protein